MTAFDWGKWRRCSNSQSGIQAYLGWRRRGRRPRWLGPSTPAASPAYQAHTVSQKNDIFIDWKFYLWNLKHLFFSCFLVSTIFHTAVLPWNAEVWRCSMLKEAWKFGARERIAKVHIHCSRYKLLCICCKHSIHIRCFGVLLFIIDNFPRDDNQPSCRFISSLFNSCQEFRCTSWKETKKAVSNAARQALVVSVESFQTCMVQWIIWIPKTLQIYV